MIRFQWFPDRDASPRFFFSNNEKKKISEAIADLEKKTSAELRVHVEKRELQFSLMEQASRAFDRLGMAQTRDRNGVLIFICSDSHEFSILGDSGIYAKVSATFWQMVSDQMTSKFRDGFLLDGVCLGITLAGAELKIYFPFHPDDRNELPNTVSLG